MFSRTSLIRLVYFFALICTIAVAVGILLILQTKEEVYRETEHSLVEESDSIPFPVSVDAIARTIEDSSEVNDFYLSTLAENTIDSESWFNQATAFLATFDWYQNLASPVSRIIVVWPGERKEQIAKNVGDVLRWDKAEREEFLSYIDDAPPYFTEGTYYPGKYVSHRYATPQDIATLLSDEFQTSVLEHYSPSVAEKVPLEDALIIASLIEREASDFKNMREVSGVIWNRLFIEMPLQLDATLQYVRGSDAYEPRWWPAVRSQDKFLDSPFNTYQEAGLPPTPIANPSVEAILAALNPIKTKCLYYFHTESKEYYCSETYEQHVSKLRSLYGRGR